MACDRWWPATMISFGPRWVFALPLAVLLPAALAVRRRLAWACLLAGGVVLFAVIGFRLPWQRIRAGTGGESRARIRLMTCNIHRHAADPAALAAVVAEANPDVVAIQEWTSRDESVFAWSGPWHTRRDGELFLASRYPIVRADDLVGGRWGPAGAAVCCQLQTPGGIVPVISLHLASPHNAFDAVLHRDPSGPAAVAENSGVRRQQSQTIGRYARDAGPAVLVAGDFNTPDDSPIFRESWGDFADAFLAAGFGVGSTYHARLTAVRIDHALAGPGWRCRRCWVGPDVKSPHRPVVAEWERAE